MAGSAQKAPHDEGREAPCGDALGLLPDWPGGRVWQERVRVEEYGQPVVVCVGVELAGTVRDVIVGLLKENHVEGAAHGREELRGTSAGTASIKKQERQLSRVEQVAHCIRHGSPGLGFGFPEVVRGMTRGAGFGEAGFPAVAVLICGGGRF